MFFGGYEVELAAGKPPAGLSIRLDSNGVPERTRIAGVRSNWVMGGLLLQQVRHPLGEVVLGSGSAACQSKYAKLRADCVRVKYSTTNLQDLGGIGEDPVFDSGSPLYLPDVAGRPWTRYNFSEGNTEISSGDIPFGFNHYPMPGMPDGYPIFFDTRLGANRTSQLLSYLKEGRYLSPIFTSHMLGQMLVYNPAEKVFGFWRATFSWGGDGRVHLKHWLAAIPAVDYSRYIQERAYGRFVPDWIMVLFVSLYGAATLLDVVRALLHQRRLQRARDGEALEKITPEELFRRKQQAKRRWTWRVTPFWVCWEVGASALQIASLALLYWYVFQLSPGAPTATTFDVYDADTWAPARYFMVKKNESGWNPYMANQLLSIEIRSASAPSNQSIDLAATATSLPLPAMPAAGGDYRWMLPDDLAPLRQLAHTYEYVGRMEHTWTLYYFLQGIVLVMLMVRLMHYVAFQPQLALIGGAITRALPMLAYWAAVTCCVVGCVLVLLATSFGYRLSNFATLSSAAYTLMRYIIVINRNGDSRATITELLDMSRLEAHPGELAVSGLVRALGPLFLVWCLYAFVFAIILRQFRRLRKWRRRAPTLAADIRNMVRWWQQKSWYNAPRNKEIDRTIDWITRPEVRHSWAYGALYNVVVRGVAAMSGGVALARRHPLQHQAATERAVLLTGHPGGTMEEPDPRVCPRYNLRSLIAVFEELLMANKELRRELYFFFNTNAEDARSKRMKVLARVRARTNSAPIDASARTMAETLAHVVLDRFGRRVPRKQARNFADLLHQMRRRLGAAGSSAGGSEAGSMSGSSAADSDDDVLPTGMRVGDLRHHGGFGAQTAMTLAELQLQSAVQTAMRNVHHIRENMGRELGDDPQLLATLFVAQFAGMIPEPESRPAAVRPSLYRQRVVEQGGSSLVRLQTFQTSRAATPPPPQQQQQQHAQGPVAAVTDGHTPEGMLTRALQAMLAAPTTGTSPLPGAVSAGGVEQGGVADGVAPARARPRAAKTRARFSNQLEDTEGGAAAAAAGEAEPEQQLQVLQSSSPDASVMLPDAAAAATAGSPSLSPLRPGAHPLAGSRTARSMLPSRPSWAGVQAARAASVSSVPATLGSMGGLLGPAASPPALSAPGAAAASGGGSINLYGSMPPGSAGPSSVQRPQIHKMRSASTAALAAARMRSFVNGAPGEITGASSAAGAPGTGFSTPQGSMGRRSGVATPRGDLIAAQIGALPLDRVVIFATAAGVVQRLTSHVLQLLRELEGVQADADAMLRSTGVLIERLSAGNKPFPRRVARMMPGMLSSPVNSPPVSPQTEKPPGWEDAAAARVAAANAALAAKVAASAAGAGAGTTSPRFGSLRVRVEEPEDMLPLPPPPGLRGADSYNNSPRKLPALQSPPAALAPLQLSSPTAALLRPPQPTPQETPDRSPPPESTSELPPLPVAAMPYSSAAKTGILNPRLAQPVDEIREVAPEPVPVTVAVKTKRATQGGDAAALAAAALADTEADREAREALAEEAGIPRPPPGPPAVSVVPPLLPPRTLSASSATSQTFEPGMRLLTPPDKAHRRSGTPRSSTPRVGSPLPHTEAILRLSPEPSFSSSTGSRPATLPGAAAAAAAAGAAGALDRTPAREAAEEAGAQRNLPPGGSASGENGVEELRLPEAPAAWGSEAPLVDAPAPVEEEVLPLGLPSPASHPHGRMAFTEASLAPRTHDPAEDAPGGSSARPAGPLPSGASTDTEIVTEEDIRDESALGLPGVGSPGRPRRQPPPRPRARYVPPPSREPDMESEPLPPAAPPGPPASRSARLLTGVPLPPPPSGVPAPLKRRGVSLAASPSATTNFSSSVQPPRVLTPEAALSVIHEALASTSRPSRAASRSVAVPPDMERRQAQLARQQELLAAAQAAVAARRMRGNAASRGVSRGEPGLSGGETSPYLSDEERTSGRPGGMSSGASVSGGVQPSNAEMLAAAALERRQAEEAAHQAYVAGLMSRMRAGMSGTGERLAMSGRLVAPAEAASAPLSQLPPPQLLQRPSMGGRSGGGAPRESATSDTGSETAVVEPQLQGPGILFPVPTPARHGATMSPLRARAAAMAAAARNAGRSFGGAGAAAAAVSAGGAGSSGGGAFGPIVAPPPLFTSPTPLFNASPSRRRSAAPVASEASAGGAAPAASQEEAQVEAGNDVSIEDVDFGTLQRGGEFMPVPRRRQANE
ncbi:hypothetical protein Agub_g15415 [Astrephomene gubernaculifera]|uniref:Polycystin cation channel PKD1/PKD2 domain-containing protein n=1 Tax=Astrephomene gubernaculifera TaxID=47775 RepID=A0AAD3E323_9CHLO|nr:hypothetical protein Agub_g15415 [Astrephomene gubernaculifera]